MRRFSTLRPSRSSAAASGAGAAATEALSAASSAAPSGGGAAGLVSGARERVARGPIGLSEEQIDPLQNVGRLVLDQQGGGSGHTQFQRGTS